MLYFCAKSISIFTQILILIIRFHMNIYENIYMKFVWWKFIYLLSNLQNKIQEREVFICFQICKKKKTPKRESLIAFKLLGKTKSIFDEWKSKEHVSLKKQEVLNNFGAKCRIGGLILWKKAALIVVKIVKGNFTTLNS